MSSKALKPKDGEPMIGQRNRVYEVLKGKGKADHGYVVEVGHRAF